MESKQFLVLFIACSVLSLVYGTQEHTTFIPEISIHGTLFVERGDTLRLVCNATGREYPPASIDWFKDGNKIKNDERITLTSDVFLSERITISTLSIRKCHVGDAGMYFCRTSDLQLTSVKVNILNTDTSHEKRGNLTIDIQPKTQPVWFVKGRSLMLTCIVHTDQRVDIVWTRNVLPVDPIEYNVETWNAGDSANPTRNARITKQVAGDVDVGLFRCSARGYDQMIQTAMFQILTAGATISEGLNSTLRCQIDLDYTVKRITWYKGAIPLSEITELKERTVLGPNNSTISFIDASLSDSGLYSCHVEINPDTEILQEFQEYVGLQGKPYISQKTIKKMDQDTSHSSIVLNCRVHGYPVPDVFWKKGNAFLDSSDKIQITHHKIEEGMSLLKINNPTDSDLEQYTCIAENGLGRDSFTFDLANSGTMNLVFRLPFHFYIVAVVLAVGLTK